MNDTDSLAVSTPDGIPGFEKSKRWVLEREDPEAVFALLRSLDLPGVGILVAEPWSLAPGYSPDLPDDELARIEVDAPEDLEVYVVATLAPDRQQIYLNLAAPLVVHSHRRLGRQVILDRQGWPLRHPVSVRG